MYKRQTNNGVRYTDWRRHAASHYDKSRYHLLNLHAAFSTERPAHTIEFRAFNGTLHAGEVKSYICLLYTSLFAGLVPRAEKPGEWVMHGDPPDFEHEKSTSAVCQSA